MKSLILKKGFWLLATIAAEYILLRLLQKQESAEMDEAESAEKKKSSPIIDHKGTQSHRLRKSKKATSRSREVQH